MHIRSSYCKSWSWCKLRHNRKRSNIVLSRRVMLEQDRESKRAATLEAIEEGKVVEGIVKNITEYGVFVDLGGVDGLLHITDISWGRVKHPSELFAIGDEVGSGVSNASVYGWMCGQSAVEIAKQKDYSDTFELGEEVQKRVEILSRIRTRKGYGPDWKETNIALQQIMLDYAGYLRSAVNMKAGLFHLRRLRKKALETVIAKNPHELVRSLEVMNLLDFGELVFISGLDRKESRDTHVRTDYVITDPRLNNKAHIIKIKEGQPVTDWRSI